jgi:hypothetical protein
MWKNLEKETNLSQGVSRRIVMFTEKQAAKTSKDLKNMTKEVI